MLLKLEKEMKRKKRGRISNIKRDGHKLKIFLRPKEKAADVLLRGIECREREGDGEGRWGERKPPSALPSVSIYLSFFFFLITN